MCPSCTVSSEHRSMKVEDSKTSKEDLDIGTRKILHFARDLQLYQVENDL